MMTTKLVQQVLETRHAQFVEAGGFSLRALALYLKIPYFKLRNAAIKPVPGVVYVEGARNYPAVAAALAKHFLTDDCDVPGLDLFEDLFDEDLDSPNDRDAIWRGFAERKSNFGGGGTSSLIKRVLDGNGDFDALGGVEVGKYVWLRESDVPFRIVHLTREYVVLQQQNSESVKCLNHKTFIFKGPSRKARGDAAVWNIGTQNETPPPQEVADAVDAVEDSPAVPESIDESLAPAKVAGGEAAQPEDSPSPSPSKKGSRRKSVDVGRASERAAQRRR